MLSFIERIRTIYVFDMKFTLKLCDYLEQYAINHEKNNIHCPVCYDKVLELNQPKDIEHILSCYKMQLIELELERHYNLHGDFPELDESFIYNITSRVDSEVETMMFDDVSLR